MLSRGQLVIEFVVDQQEGTFGVVGLAGPPCKAIMYGLLQEAMFKVKDMNLNEAAVAPSKGILVGANGK